MLEVASDYIKAIFQHALTEIESDVLDPSLLDGYKKAFVLTVPAVWSDKAKDMTLRVIMDPTATIFFLFSRVAGPDRSIGSDTSGYFAHRDDHGTRGGIAVHTGVYEG